MTIEENIDETEEAVCITNNLGRILTANKRFCKMFGFEQSEIKWHYLCDLYRRKEDFGLELLQTRMRNRSGRGFSCFLTCKSTKSMEGIPLLMYSIQRVA